MKVPWYMRPRILYAGVFTWITMTGGRFLAPFLEHRIALTAEEIGTNLALYQVCFTLTGSAGGAWADQLESRFPGKGRALVMGLGVSLGFLSMFLHETRTLLPQVQFFASLTWFLVLRCLYAISSSLIFPVMDGMTLTFLEQHDASKADYGKERLFGAVSWAIAHMMLAVSLDVSNDFVVMYYWAAFSTIGLLVTIYMYVRWTGVAIQEARLCTQDSNVVVAQDFKDEEEINIASREAYRPDFTTLLRRNAVWNRLSFRGVLALDRPSCGRQFGVLVF